MRKVGGMSDETQVQPGTRPPFQNRNLAAMKVGYRSPRVYGKLAEQIAADLVDSIPVMNDYPEELAAISSMEAVVALMRLDIAARGLRDQDGNTRLAFIDRYIKAENAAAKRRDALGISPLGQAVLAKERASAASIASGVDLEALAARGRAALDNRTDIVSAVLENEKATYQTERAEAAREWAARTDQTPALANEAVTQDTSTEDGEAHDD